MEDRTSESERERPRQNSIFNEKYLRATKRFHLLINGFLALNRFSPTHTHPILPFSLVQYHFIIIVVVFP